MYQKTTVTETDGTIRERHGKWCCFHSGLSWSGIFAGAFVALGISFLLDLFGMGLGISAYKAATTAGEAKAFAYGGYIAILVAGMVAMFVGGWVAGFIGRPTCTTGCHGMIYGFVAWCLALIISIILVSSIGQFIGVQYSILNASSSGNIESYNNPNSKMSNFSNNTNTGREATNNNRYNANENSEKAASDAAKGFFLLFLIFITSALAAAFGGYTAVKSIRHDEEVVGRVK